MRAKLLAGTAALALVACTLTASVETASARPWGWHGGFWPGAVAAGVIGGAVATATSPFWAPGYYNGYSTIILATLTRRRRLSRAATTSDGARRISAPIIRRPAPIWVMTACNTLARNLNEHRERGASL